MSDSLTYNEAGVGYDTLDSFKRACQQAAASTASALKLHNLSEPPNVRGESAYVLETPSEYLAHVEEGLGTKNLVADAMIKLTGDSRFYHNIGIDTVATMVNDLITCGALPVSIAMHAAVGDSNWFANIERARHLARGFAEGCRESNAVWGGGETPALKGIVNPESIVLAGSALGRISPKSHRITGNVEHGDAIVLLASSGVHTNGLTLCRAIAEKLPQGYLTKLADGRTYGEALLDPSVIYVKFIAACQAAEIPLHYAAHVTGHGWRKLMRLDQPFVYKMHDLGSIPEIFNLIMSRGPVDIREAYGTFNMGAGFAVWVDPDDADKVIRIAESLRYTAWHGGTVYKDGARKAVELLPLELTFEADTLKVR